MDSLFLGAYWKARKENKEECARRISNFLRAIEGAHPSLTSWFLKGTSRNSARISVDVSPVGIGALLATNNRDLDGIPIPELGFSLGMWNGTNASISISVGAYGPNAGNAVVLLFQGKCPVEEAIWRRIIEAAVSSFDPDTAVVTNNDYIERHGRGFPDDAGGWLNYSRGGIVEQKTFP